MENKKWQDFIPVYLRTIDTYFKNIKKAQGHTLIVEGGTDKNFYFHLFQISSFVHEDEEIVFETPSLNIISNFTLSYINILKNQNKKKEITKEMEFFGEEIDVIKKGNYGSLIKYDFVIECMAYYEKNTKNLNFLNCYGIIDKDFGHNETRNLKNIAITKFHDRETTLLRFFLPKLINQCLNKEKAVELLSSCIDTLFKQGIIEEESHKFEKKEGYDSFLRELTHNYFDRNSNQRDFRKGFFDFNEYIRNYEKYIEPIFIYCDIIEHKSNYESFINHAIERIRKTYTFEGELSKLLYRWIIENKTNDIDETRIDRIFKYVNGHFLLQQMIKFGKDIFEFNNEDEVIKQIIDEFLSRKRMYPIIFDALPLKKYKKYREDNGLYTHKKRLYKK